MSNRFSKLLTLVVALTVGATCATGVKAGTELRNTASATFQNPATLTQNTVLSDAVSATVLALPGFDLLYRSGSDGTAAGGVLPVGYTPTVMPGGEVQTAYIVSNTGNVDNYVVTLNADTTGTAAASNPRPPASVTYFVDTNNDGLLSPAERGLGAVTQVTVPADDVLTPLPADEGRVAIIQVMTVPAAANPGETYAASPRGTGAAYADGVNPGVGTLTEAVTDLQFTRAAVYVPTVTNNPSRTSSTPSPDAPPSLPALPGYSDPQSGLTTILVDADNQSAYPTAGTTQVTFSNSVTNTGTLSDTVNLFLTNAGVTNNLNGSFTIPVRDSAGNPALATIRFLLDDGSALLPRVNGIPTLVVPAGRSADYRVEVTFPYYDTGDSDPAPILLTIAVDSGNDADLLSDDLTADTIYPPEFQFGDATAALGTSPAPSPVETVVVTGGTSLIPGNVSDRTAIFPMDLANLGEYPETYSLSSRLDVPITTSTTPAEVIARFYIDANNDGFPETLLPVDSDFFSLTGTVAPNTELKVWAVFDLPADARATLSSGLSSPLKPLIEAAALYAGSLREDSNNQISIPLARGVDLVKSVDQASAVPGSILTYTITATNRFNGDLQNFSVREADGTGAVGHLTNVFATATFESVTASPTFLLGTGTVVYRFNGGSWSISPAAPAMVTSVEVGVDTTGDASIDGSDLFPAGGVLDITLKVRVK
ncbi:hypothetical protein ACFFLM_22815 [Deinococcus oregonensis]|uniref:DUF11 domain-containing protein n=1 Tax=Deinococcus oregonensis TaxID=1805970 RepID=A0ABV6B8N7_9DEIO